MRAIIPVIFASLLISGCGTPSATKVKFGAMPPELSDCTTYRLSEGNGLGHVIVMRCPNSTTTTQHADPNPEIGTRHGVVTDGGKTK